jgi:cytosine deaminase
LFIYNARQQGKDGLWEIEIQDGLIKNISAMEQRSRGKEDLDAEGGLVLPPFIEPHIHLDTTLTAGEPSWNVSGTLFEGIEKWAERKKLLTADDVKKRAGKVLQWHIAQGVQYVRTHIDVTDPNLTALKAMLEVKREVSPWIELQIVAFPQEGIQSYPDGAKLLEESIRMGADAIGGIPHYEFTREYGVESIKKVFELAVKYDRLVDIHCDETDDEQSRFVEVVAAEAHRYGIGEKVTASHTTAMHSYNNAYCSRLFRLLKLSGINIVANPLVNIHLQGRFDGYPKRRGITRVKELQDAGINVCFGHDDLCDPWYPLGTGNMLQVLFMGIHVCHMTGYEQILKAMNLITYNSAKTMHILDRYGIEAGKPANLIILPATDGYEAIRRQVPVRYSIRQGKLISKTELQTTSIYVDGQEQNIDFSKS